MTDDAIAIRREPLSFPCFHSHGDFDAHAMLIEYHHHPVRGESFQICITVPRPQTLTCKQETVSVTLTAPCSSDMATRCPLHPLPGSRV